MKFKMTVISVLLLLSLDFLALHDIINGEPDLSAEYGILGISVIAASGLVISLRCGKKDS